MSTSIKWKLIIIVLLTIAATMTACLSEIDIDLPPNSEDKVVIVSELKMGEPSTIVARITGLSPFSSFEQPINIENALVSLIDENGNAEIIPYANNGVYFNTVSQLSIQTGKQYQLSVEINGNRYESKFEKLHAVPKAINIEHAEIVRSELNEQDNIIENKYLQFFIDTPLTSPGSDDKVYLKWDFQGVYRFVETSLGLPFPPPIKTCYYSQTLNLDKIAIYNGPESRETILEKEFLLEEKLDYRFARGFYLNAYQQTLSEGAFEYWEQINAITDLSGSFFEDPPGKIIGNFTNINDPNEEVFGYFYATQTDTIRALVKSTDYLVSPICPSVGLPEDQSIRATCFDCLRQTNSTTIKPSYWIE